MKSSNKEIILHAANVYCGGGLSLLKAVINELPIKSILILDARLSIKDKVLEPFDVYRIKPTLWHRFKGELLLKSLACKEKQVLCFANLPPLFKLKSSVTVFMQNRYLVEPSLERDISFKLYLRLTIERFWLRFFNKNIDKMLVQTRSMKVLLGKIVLKPIVIASFTSQSEPSSLVKKHKIEKTYEFIYVAFGELHKNHRNLLLAWVELARENYFPTLCLTVCDKAFPALSKEITQMTLKYKLNIDNLGVVPLEKVYQLYQESKALIFPSTLESFGLPLLEAKERGLKVIASELDYVRDLIDPDEGFDPYSPLSIARAVRRLMGIDSRPQALMSAHSFLKEI